MTTTQNRCFEGNCPPGYSNPTGAGAAQTPQICTVCGLGQYCVDGLAHNCPPGTTGAGGPSATGASACSSCPAGTSAAVGINSCTPCSPGTYSATGTTCSPCLAGTFAHSGATACSPCPAGNYCLGATGAPTPCPLNSYRSITGASGSADCTQCPHTAATTSPGSTSISACKCPAGQTPNSDGSKCVKITCPTGHYMPTLTSLNCAACNDIDGKEYTAQMDSCFGNAGWMPAGKQLYLVGAAGPTSYMGPACLYLPKNSMVADPALQTAAGWTGPSFGMPHGVRMAIPGSYGPGATCPAMAPTGSMSGGCMTGSYYADIKSGTVVYPPSTLMGWAGNNYGSMTGTYPGAWDPYTEYWIPYSTPSQQCDPTFSHQNAGIGVCIATGTGTHPSCGNCFPPTGPGCTADPLTAGSTATTAYLSKSLNGDQWKWKTTPRVAIIDPSPYQGLCLGAAALPWQCPGNQLTPWTA